ncbi:hypothetical protein CEXT_709061, partial [Caerostris extrusa]
KTASINLLISIRSQTRILTKHSRLLNSSADSPNTLRADGNSPFNQIRELFSATCSALSFHPLHRLPRKRGRGALCREREPLLNVCCEKKGWEFLAEEACTQEQNTRILNKHSRLLNSSADFSKNVEDRRKFPLSQIRELFPPPVPLFRSPSIQLCLPRKRGTELLLNVCCERSVGGFLAEEVGGRGPSRLG